MGCASSNPLVASGKNFVDTAKESASELANKGEHVIKDVGETAKDGFHTGVGHVKGALETAEHNIGSMVGKITDTFHGAKNDAHEAVEETERVAEESLKKAHESMVEAVSEAETVLASEAENVEDFVSHQVVEAKEVAESAEERVEAAGEMAFQKVEKAKLSAEKFKDFTDSLEIEDMDQTLELLEKEVGETEEVAKRLPTPAHSPTEAEAKKEEPPTYWEARADAILEQRIKSIDLEALAPNSETDPKMDPPIIPIINIENIETPPSEDHLGEVCEHSDNTSVNSFVLTEK